MAVLLSICCITYNHELFIARAIEGFLIQQTSFEVEIIVGDDSSTDGTLQILETYRHQYPQLIRILASEKNLGPLQNEYNVLSAANGKYIAYCEGDDYWTDPHKLQKQVDFMELNPEYSVSFHRCRHYDWDRAEWNDDNCGQFFINNTITGIDITLSMFFNRWITQPLTMVYRRKAIDPDIAMKYRSYRDIHQIYHLLENGKGYLFAFDGGVRIMHRSGLASMKDIEYQCNSILGIAGELYRMNRNSFTRKYYKDILQWSIYEFSAGPKRRQKAFKSTFMLFIVQGSLRRLIANTRRIIS